MANGGESTTAIMGWGGAVTGIAALQGLGVGAFAGGVGIGALNPATSLLSGAYGQFDGSAGSTQSVAAPTTAPKGGGGARESVAGALSNVLGNVGAARRPPSACDVGMCLAQATPAGEGAPSFETFNDGTGGGVPFDQRSAIIDWLVSRLAPEVSLVINVIVNLEEHRQAYMRGEGSSGGRELARTSRQRGGLRSTQKMPREMRAQMSCENCGTDVVPGQKSQSGVTPPANERQRDHIIPKSKNGDGAPSNGQILCRGCNLKKSDKLP